MKPSPVQIELALSGVLEVNSQKDIILSGILEQIEVGENKVLLKISSDTDYSFAQKNRLKQECARAIHENVSNLLDVDVQFEKRKLSRQTEESYHSIKNIIAIVSGKGGVGKSTVAANLAISLSENGNRVGLLDTDIYGPSIPVLFKVNSGNIRSTEKDGKPILIPAEKYGVKLMSVGFFVEDQQALIWRGPMASNALKQLIAQTEWGELDYLILDLPPGTGDVQLTLIDLLPITAVLMVSTPQQIAIADVKRAFDMFRKEGKEIPVLGLVENMAFFMPDDQSDGRKYYLFGREGCKELGKELNIKILAEIPLIYQDEENNLLASLVKGSLGEGIYNRLTSNVIEELSKIKKIDQ